MASGLKTIIYPGKRNAAARAQFGVLIGAELYIDQPYYVAFVAMIEGVDGNLIDLMRDAAGS